MKKIAAFSKYLAYDMGGAEASTRELLLQATAQGHDITILFQRDATFLGHSIKRTRVPSEWHLIEIEGITNNSRSAYLEYARNAKMLQQYFAHQTFDELWTYGTLAPAAALAFAGPVRYYIRSESDIGITGNYQAGLKRFLKHGHNLAQWPAIQRYKHDLRRALNKSTVVANSMYMANEVRKRFNVDASVVYPTIDIASMAHALEQHGRHAQDVVFVGDSSWKGIDIVLALARRMPDTRFTIYSRVVGATCTDRNIHWEQWTAEPWRMYQRAKIVIVPSQCVEAYGRVSREAKLLNIPVLVSNTGGLPESVDQDPTCIVHDYTSVNAWHHALQERLALLQVHTS